MPRPTRRRPRKSCRRWRRRRPSLHARLRSIGRWPNGQRPRPATASTTPAAADATGRAAAAASRFPRPAATTATSASAGADAPLAAAPDYAFGVRLDPGPRPLADIEPDYPDMKYLREGVVVLRLLISEKGAGRQRRRRPCRAARDLRAGGDRGVLEGEVLARAGRRNAGQEPDHGRGPVHADQSRRPGVRQDLLRARCTGRKCCAAVFFVLGGRVGAQRGRNREGVGDFARRSGPGGSVRPVFAGQRARRLRRRLRRPHQGREAPRDRRSRV